jgi:hypothetical protein
MGIETYHGKTYYYRKTREGGRVRSEYVASGDMALLMAAADRVEREERAEEAEAERSKLAELDAEEKQIAAYLEGVDQAVSDALRAAGYHRPSRKLEWMRNKGPRAKP